MLEDLKRMLGLSGQKDEELDQKLNWILATTRARLKVLLGGIDPGKDLDYIITEVSIVRYNRTLMLTWMISRHIRIRRTLMYQKEESAGYEIRHTCIFPEDHLWKV